MKRIWCCIRPHRLEEVKTAIADLGATGMSVSDVRGTGNSPETARSFAGQSVVVPLPVRAKLDVVVPDALVPSVVEAILRHAWTGEPGDGKIFLEPVTDAIRIRTGERGEDAI